MNTFIVGLTGAVAAVSLPSLAGAQQVDLNGRSILQIASERDEPRSRRDHAYRAISFEVLDGVLLDPLVR